MTTENNLFAKTNRKSLSFKGMPVGTTVHCDVVAAPREAQSFDFETKKPKFWPAKDGETPKPVMAVVVDLTINGDAFSVWAVKPSSMFTAIADAVEKAGAMVGPGGRLSITLADRRVVAGKEHLNPQAIYSAVYVPPNAFAQAPAPAAAPAPAPAGPVGPPPPPAALPIAPPPPPAPVLVDGHPVAAYIAAGWTVDAMRLDPKFAPFFAAATAGPAAPAPVTLTGIQQAAVGTLSDAERAALFEE